MHPLDTSIRGKQWKVKASSTRRRSVGITALCLSMADEHPELGPDEVDHPLYALRVEANQPSDIGCTRRSSGPRRAAPCSILNLTAWSEKRGVNRCQSPGLKMGSMAGHR